MCISALSHRAIRPHQKRAFFLTRGLQRPVLVKSVKLLSSAGSTCVSQFLVCQGQCDGRCALSERCAIVDDDSTACRQKLLLCQEPLDRLQDGASWCQSDSSLLVSSDRFFLAQASVTGQRLPWQVSVRYQVAAGRNRRLGRGHQAVIWALAQMWRVLSNGFPAAFFCAMIHAVQPKLLIHQVF